MEYKFVSNSSEETTKLGLFLGELVNANDVILLNGDLGAGKTTLTKGVAKGLGIKDRVNSPTFNIMKIYFGGRIPLFHIDAYRLEDSNKDIGLEEFIDGDGVCLIEWPNYINEFIPPHYLSISISHLGDDKREIIITSNSEHYDSYVSKIREKFKCIHFF